VAEGYRDLFVWQRSIQLTVALYRLTENFPKQEIYGLTSQLRRAGVSVASNIAEGWGRQSDGEFRQFLGMARGSNMEVATQLVIASELNFGLQADRNAAISLSNEVGKMIVSLMKTV
jgi:four helix bundle protein